MKNRVSSTCVCVCVLLVIVFRFFFILRRAVGQTDLCAFAGSSVNHRHFLGGKFQKKKISSKTTLLCTRLPVAYISVFPEDAQAPGTTNRISILLFRMYVLVVLFTPLSFTGIVQGDPRVSTDAMFPIPSSVLLQKTYRTTFNWLKSKIF